MRTEMGRVGTITANSVEVISTTLPNHNNLCNTHHKNTIQILISVLSRTGRGNISRVWLRRANRTSR